MRWESFALALLLLSGGCGITHQYVIPRGSDGALASTPKDRLRASACASCDMWVGEEPSPLEFLRIGEHEGLVIEFRSSHRCFPWLLFFPIPIWDSCSPLVGRPHHLIQLRIHNTTTNSIPLRASPVRVTISGEQIALRPTHPLPERIAPGESITTTLDIGEWDPLASGYELALGDVVEFNPSSMSVERFSTTTFGLFLVD